MAGKDWKINNLYQLVHMLVLLVLVLTFLNSTATIK